MIPTTRVAQGEALRCVLLTLALCTTGCAASSAQAKPTTPSADDITDTDIGLAVSGELLADPAVPYDPIEVSVRNSIVTLQGSVQTLLARERAEELAETVRGVRSVINQVDVEPAVARTDWELQQDVKNALFFDRATEGYEIEVRVEQGVATLTGEVESFAESKLAERVAMGVRGLRGVDNQLTVQLEESRLAEEIEADIEKRLRWDGLVEHGRIDVSVNAGNVTLEGVVGSAAEKSRAELDAWVAGVKSVDTDQLKVEAWADDPDQRNRMRLELSDQAIANAIEEALRYDARASAFDVDVSVKNGRATLSGVVDNLEAKRAAAQVARSTTGVLRVRNLLRVKSAAPGDEELARRIRAALTRNAVTESYEISVDVDNAVAELRGTVDDYFEKGEADRVAARVHGIEAVDNDLEVRHDAAAWVYDPYVSEEQPQTYTWYSYGPRPSHATDTEIVDSIEDEMFWSPYVDADDVRVEVNDGIAELDGRVDSVVEMQAAVENAYEGGATWVDNDLAVDF